MKVKNAMGKDKLHTYKLLIKNSKKTRIHFKLPKVLHLVIQDQVKTNLSGYYLEIVSFLFYKRYEEFFNEVVHEEQPQKRSLSFDDLQLASDAVERVKQYGIADTPINNRNCPEILIKVSEHIRIRVGSKDSKNTFFRNLTLPFAIQTLQNEIDEKIKVIDN